MRRTLSLLLLIGALALVAAGCGSDDSGDSSSTSSSAAATTDTGTSSSESTGSEAAGGGITIKMENIAFSPKEQTVKVGEKVTWVNDDTVDHDVKATSGADFGSDTFGKDGTFSFTPDKAGTIEYVCTLHQGMTGTLTVTG